MKGARGMKWGHEGKGDSEEHNASAVVDISIYVV